MGISRRNFIGKTALAAASSSVLPMFAVGKPGRPANEKLNVAVVGAGGMGGMAVGRAGKENIVAFCDVDHTRAAKAYEKHPDVPRFQDFRRMLDRHHNEIDVVLVSTPDHTHFPATIASMELGKRENWL